MLQNLSIFMRSAGSFHSGNLWIFIGIAAAACVLGIEVACIGVLIRKLSHARRHRKMMEEREAEERYGNYSAMMLLTAAAIPLTAELVFSVLVGLVALAALVLLVMLIVIRACGYDFAVSEPRQSESGSEEAAVESVPVQEDLTAPEQADEPVSTPAAEETPDEPMPEELPDEPAPEEPPAPADEPEPEAVPEPVEEAPAEEPAVAAFAGENGMTAAGGPIPGGAGAQGPMRYVRIEKEYSETVKEVHTTTPAPAPTASDSDAHKELLEKLNTLIDKIDRKQDAGADADPADGGAASGGTAAGGTVAGENAAGATSPVGDEEEDDDDDLDEDSAEEAAEDKLDEDADDEPDDPEHFTGNERIIGFDEETGCYIVAHYRKSFEAKLIQARPNIKQYYSELKNALLAYGGTKSRISWAADSFTNERDQIAKINVKTRTLELYLALDPASLDETVYKGTDVGHVKKYADTPFRYKLRTPRKFKWAMELVERVCEEHGLSPIDAEKIDYETMYPFEDTDSLVSRGLIKEYIREEKPASTFELDDTHVPFVPAVDETVIPANANISWELDNEQLAQKEPEPVDVPEPEPEPAPEPEPIPEPVPEPEPTAEAPKQEPAPGTTVIRETTKVTQMRYTEQYYGAVGDPQTYKQYTPAEAPFVSDDFFETPVTDPAKTSETVQTVQTEETVQTHAEEKAPEAPAEEAPEAAESAAEEPADEPAEEQYEAEQSEQEADEPEPESSLLSAFEQSDDDKADDLDWGIPASLTVQTPIYISEQSIPTEAPAEEAQEEVIDEEGYAEEPSAFAEEEEPTYEESNEYSDDGSVYDEADGSVADEPAYEETDEYAEIDAYAGEETAYDENAGYAEDEPAYDETAEYAGDEYVEDPGYAEDDTAYGESDEYAGYAEDGTAYDENTGYADDGTVYDEAEEYSGETYGDEPAYDGNGDYDTAEYDRGEAYEDAPEPPPQAHVNPNIALIDVSVFEANFPYGSVINLEALKAKGLVLPSAKVLKVFAAGEISKAFTVEADQFSLDAIRAIDNAGGEILMVKK